MAFKRSGVIHLGNDGCDLLIADARDLVGWTGRMVDGDWFRFPLGEGHGRSASWNDGEGILVRIPPVHVPLIATMRDEALTIFLFAMDAWTGTPVAFGKLVATAVAELGTVEVTSGWLGILDAHRPGDLVPADCARAARTRECAGVMVVQVSPGAYVVSHQQTPACPRIRITRAVQSLNAPTR